MYNRSRRIYLALASGLLLGISWNLFPAVIFIAMVPLLILENDLSNSGNSASGTMFWLSWLCFIIWNGSAAWWIGYASLSGAIALLSFNSFWMAVVFWLFHISRCKLKIKAGWLIFVAYWLTYEYIYQRTEISWPWFNLGNIFGNMTELVQWYEYTGTLGGTLWILLINIGVADTINTYLRTESIKSIRFGLFATVAMLVLPSILSIRMHYNYREILSPVKIAVIQPNIDPYNEKFSDLTPADQVKVILNEAEKAKCGDIDYFVGPETAILGKNLESEMLESNSVTSIKRFLEKCPGARFVVGAETQRVYFPGEILSQTAQKDDSANVWEDRYNSAIHIDSSDHIQIYHKSKLVIGVEKMPFSKYLQFLNKFHIQLGGTFDNLGDQDFRETFIAADSTSVAPIICFESVYGKYVTDYVKVGASILFVITNDGWWKNSAGTWQHLNLSRLRAIETRRSIARSANTGVSAFINQKGDVANYLDYGKRGFIVDNLNNNKRITFYVQYGDYPGIIALIMSLLSFGCVLFMKWHKKERN